MKLEYLKATIVDEPQIIKILEELNGDRSVFDINHFMVVKNESSIIGCIRVKVFAGGLLELASLAVLENYQGQGVGSELVRKFLLSETSRPIFLLTSLDKESFYKKFNFNIIDPAELPEEFKNEYLHIINLPFTKSIQVIAMVLK